MEKQLPDLLERTKTLVVETRGLIRALKAEIERLSHENEFLRQKLSEMEKRQLQLEQNTINLQMQDVIAGKNIRYKSLQNKLDGYIKQIDECLSLIENSGE